MVLKDDWRLYPESPLILSRVEKLPFWKCGPILLKPPAEDTDLARLSRDILSINPSTPYCPELFSDDGYASLQQNRRLGFEDIGGLGLLRAQIGGEAPLHDVDFRPDDLGSARAAPGWRSIRGVLKEIDLLLEPEPWIDALAGNAAGALQPEGAINTVTGVKTFVNRPANEWPLSLRELFQAPPTISNQTWAFAKQDLEDEKLRLERLDSNHFSATG